MSSPSIPSERTYTYVAEQLAQGLSRDRILDDLKPEAKDRDIFARYVAAVPTPHAKQKYRTVNNLLVAALSADVLFKVYLLSSGNVPSTFFGLLVLFLSLAIWLTIQILQFRGFVYRFVFLFCLIELGLLVFTFAAGGISRLVLLLNSLDIWLVGLLALILARRLFPHIGMFTIRKDAAGNYRW